MMKVKFPGGKKVDAIFKGFTFKTDQPCESGGEGSAPDPFSMFLASLATCSGFFVKNFCDQRGIDAREIELFLNTDSNDELGKITAFHLEINVPAEFPAKYEKALVQTAKLCKVKKHLDPQISFNCFVTRKGS
ncbi:MAG: osmotically inducible protein OsmC [Acidobacteria bacterium]|nr:MAG: osmotically inducible protein OsmC [Acidobacteriota bacterium]